MDNTHKYGFRWSEAANGRPCPIPQEKSVATGYAAEADSAGGTDYVDLNVGDPVGLLSTGYIELANTTDLVWGIIVGVKQYYDGTQIVNNPKLPYSTAFGSVFHRRSILYVVPVTDGLWEIDADDKVTATTEALYHAFIGENAPHTCPGSGAGSPGGKADPYLDISAHATTAGLEWRIEQISRTFENRDFSGSYVKLIVRSNASQNAGVAATPVVGV